MTLTTAARALVLAQSGVDCFDDLEPEAQEAAREHVRAVLRGLWQPIETAPKDGTVILAYGTFHGYYGYTPAEQDTAKVRWLNKRWSVAQPTGRYFTGFTPTHWMPLPEPPE